MADSDGGYSRGHTHDVSRHMTVFTANEFFVAYTVGHQIRVRQLEHDDHGRAIVDLDLAPSTQVILALSDLVPNYLAVGHGGKASIYDVESATCLAAITGVGRSITSIAWSQHDSRLVATGLLDGSICTWSLDKPSRPLQRLISTHGVCSSLRFNPNQSSIFASGHGSVIIIWSLQHPFKPLKIVRNMPRIERLLWNKSCPGLLLCLAPEYGVYTFDLLDILDDELGRVAGYSDQTLDVGPDSWSRSAHTNPVRDAALRQSIPCRATDVCWYDKSSVGILLRDCHHVCMFEVMQNIDLLREVQTLRFPMRGNLLRIQAVHGKDFILFVESTSGTQSYVLSNHTKQAMSGVIDIEFDGSASARKRNNSNRRLLADDSSKDIEPGVVPGMTPIPITQTISSYETAFSAKENARRQVQSYGMDPQMGSEQRTRTPSMQPRENVSIGHSFDQRLDNGRGQRTATAVGDRLFSSQPELQSIAPITASASENHDSGASIVTQASHDSDSDDEAFGHGMRGSGTFMPEGVNVPIPKACGAIFAPNGQLLTFLTPRPPLARASQNTTREVVQISRRSQLTISRLFPTFGNLLPSSTMNYDSSASDSSDLEFPEKFVDEALLSRNTSFADAIWLNKISPVKASLDVEAPLPNLLLQIRSPELLTPGLHIANVAYQIHPAGNQSVADVAQSNSTLASQHAQPNAALVWHLLSLIVSNEPLSPFVPSNGSPAALSSVIRQIIPTQTGPDSVNISRLGDVWKSHPFGTSWLVLRLFEWTELHADVQLLSYMSAVLLAADRASAIEIAKSVGTSEEQLMATQHSAAFRDKHTIFPRNDNLTPMLRAQTASSPASESSPNKVLRTSRASSRNVSQPATPHLETSVSTPPLVFSGFVRRNSKTTLSGSASPEYHRGSFSAAAKYYAQSITDKFNAYGSSPPFKKLGTSPGVEFSSSLPNANGTGSWSKSVSFASTIEKTQESQLSSSLTVSQDDGYDSDKTIEDSSTPHTPKGDFSEIYFESKNDEVFGSNFKERSDGSFLPAALKNKAVTWRRSYASQLRTWQLYSQAAELESLSDMIALSHLADKSLDHDGMSVTSQNLQRRPICEICTTSIVGVEQVCPVCLHATHLTCLAALLEGDSGEGYTCSSGCGCTCMDLAFEIAEIAPLISAGARVMDQNIKKRTSFTDPRRWRARLEGDSW